MRNMNLIKIKANITIKNKESNSNTDRTENEINDETWKKEA